MQKKAGTHAEKASAWKHQEVKGLLKMKSQSRELSVHKKRTGTSKGKTPNGKVNHAHAPDKP
jgi:hypothetical protein